MRERYYLLALQGGVWLGEPTFTHGQLYVTASRVGNPQHLLRAVKKNDAGKTRYVVYKEILHIDKKSDPVKTTNLVYKEILWI